MSIQKNGPTLIYQQVSDWINQQIASGVWPEHYQLPSEIDLAKQLGVSRGTVRKALSELIQRGELVSIHGRGTFVSSKTLEQPLAEHLIAFSEDLLQKGIPYETRVIEQRLIRPPAKIAAFLAVSEDEDIFSIKRVRSIFQKPIVVLENYIACRFCPGIEKVDFSKQRVFQTLEEKYGLKLGWGWRTFQAKAVSEEVSSLLEAPLCEPVMYMEQLVYQKDGSPIEYSNVWLKGDSFRLSAVVTRDKTAATRHSSITFVDS